MLQPADHPDRGAVRFLLLVFASTWLFQLPALLALHEPGLVAGPVARFMPLVVLGFFGPLLVAVILSLREPGGLRALFAPLAVWRVSVAWYVVALGLSAAIFVVTMGAYELVTGAKAGPLFYPPTSAEQLAAMLVVPLTEQLPWRGFLYPRLERRYGALAASGIVGVAWALFHVQKHVLLQAELGWTSPLVLIPFMTAGTVVFTWLQRRTRGSLLLVVLANAGIYLDNPAASPASSTPVIVHTVGFCLVALALVTLDRRAWTAAPGT